MEKETAISIKVGLFVILGVTCLVLGVYFIGNKKNLFGSNMHIRAMFRDVSGLQTGNNVRFSGITVGTVENITIVNDSTIEVNMLIDKKAGAFIRKDSRASIGTDGLMGSRLVNISSGSASSRPVRSGDAIIGLEPVQMDEMLQVLAESNRNISGITSDIKRITTEIHSGKGPAWKLLADSALANKLDAAITHLERTTAHAESTGKDMSGLIRGVRDGKGSLGKLLTDTALGNRIDRSVTDLSRTTENLSSVSDKLQQEKGVLGVLLSDTSAAQIQHSIENIEEGTNKFNENMEALRHNFLFRRYFEKKAKEKKNNQTSKP